jgi:hypothetical protein
MNVRLAILTYAGEQADLPNPSRVPRCKCEKPLRGDDRCVRCGRYLMATLRRQRFLAISHKEREFQGWDALMREVPYGRSKLGKLAA